MARSQSEKPLNWFISLIVTLIVGFVGNALWEFAIRPLFIFTLQNIITIGGILPIRDGVYRGVATGFDPKLYTSTHYLIQIIIIILLLLLSTGFSQNKFEKFLEDIAKSINITKKRLRSLLVIILSGSAIAISIIWSLEVYEAEAVSHIQQALTICSPYITEQELREFNSRIARINSRNNYKNLDKDLRKIAQENNIEIPKFKIL